MDGVRKANFHEIGFQCRPGSPELNCCSVNAARGLGLLGEWAVMRDADGLFLNWYGRGTIAAPLESGVMVNLDLDTSYPLMGFVRIRVGPEKSGPFALRLRIPHWSSRAKVKVNGEPVSSVVPGRYLLLSRSWKPGDMVELELDMTPRFWAGERESAGLASIYLGPILMAYDRRFNTIDPADLPALDAADLQGFPPADPVRPMPPMVLIDIGRSAVGSCGCATSPAPARTARPIGRG